MFDIRRLQPIRSGHLKEATFPRTSLLVFAGFFVWNRWLGNSVRQAEHPFRDNVPLYLITSAINRVRSSV